MTDKTKTKDITLTSEDSEAILNGLEQVFQMSVRLYKKIFPLRHAFALHDSLIEFREVQRALRKLYWAIRERALEDDDDVWNALADGFLQIIRERQEEVDNV